MGNLFDPKNPNTWPQNYKQRPTEAFTNVGQTPRDLAQSQFENRFATDAQTPVYNAYDKYSLRGMQTPYENFDLRPSNIAETSLMAISAPITGSMASSPMDRAASYFGGKLGSMSAEAQFAASTAKGFDASGAGGKIKDVMTPFGKTVSSTGIGTTAQQAARMGNLTTMKAKEAISGGTIFANQLASAMMKAGRTVRAITTGSLIGKNLSDIFDK
jgi:hypothetical protein